MLRFRWVVAFVLISTLSSGARAGVSDRLRETLSAIPAEAVSSGILFDRVLPLVDVAPYDGSANAPAIDLTSWRQIYFEMGRAAYDASAWPDLQEMRTAARSRSGVVPIALLDLAYQRLREDALETGALVAADGRVGLGVGDPFRSGSLVAATGLRGSTSGGASVVFRLESRWYVTNRGSLSRVEADFNDGLGFRALAFDRDVPVSYAYPGERIVHLRLTDASGAIRTTSFRFEVQSLGVPSPDDTLHVTASIPYGGQLGTANAYVYLADGHAALTNPVIVVEGFDLDNSLDWDDLYLLLNQENLLEDLRADGYDAVVLDFTDAVTFIQRNAFTIVELLQEIDALVEPGTTVALAGASMGGLCSRYALAYMENQGIPHHVRTFVSFDSPQNGANIPLGVQYWLYFFQNDSADAAALLAILNQPAARQMLAYHYTDPPTATGTSDVLRGQLDGDLLSLGDYPSQPRLVAVANGSGSRMNQGYNPGDQIIQWTYRSLLIDIDGNVWAVPDGNNHIIFQGMIDIILLPEESLDVTVIGTSPYDNAPGGSRNSMQQMADVPAPYGDIIALHNDHCFIPTISALDLDTDDLFYDIAGDPDPAAHSPFDAVYFPTENQEHVFVTPENKVWLMTEIENPSTDVAAEESGVAGLQLVTYPNPTPGASHVRFSLPEAGEAEVSVFDPAGRQLTVLANRSFAAGTHELAWEGRGVAAGVYFVRLRTPGAVTSRPLIVR
ncbi:MAG: T9SS type A sorting domain-containing protein [Candidatus Eisenbacteria bacterium]|uniref:T9SS type A sorting domain-containing protein n=1 Tax=Eiseniibacteriota bacterium TaxID=2212470 RepID=A0A956RPK8_UNCEI|nr:T9SS type A sorting domain-containing protein [Candidatus Eisenbacteria bacterium]